MLGLKQINQINVDDDKLSRIQQNIADALNPVLETPTLDCVLVTGLTIPAGGKLVVPHRMGRAALGVYVVLASAAVALPYALPADQTAPTGSIVLTFSSGAGAIVSLVVF